MTDKTKRLLVEYAARYETKDFLAGDPSQFMHKVEGRENRETTAFIASCLSYGSRKQFLPKIQFLLDCAGGDVFGWVAEGRFARDIADDSSRCYYRLYTFSAMHRLLRRLQETINAHGSLGAYVGKNASTGIEAVEAICRLFAQGGGSGPVVPKEASSACKRVCMFLRWMVRDGSPVDLGLWSQHIDKRTLIMPLDTHVLTEAARLGLMSSRSASMSAAQRLTKEMAKAFPDDPLKGDFALFGYGVSFGS